MMRDDRWCQAGRLLSLLGESRYNDVETAVIADAIAADALAADVAPIETRAETIHSFGFENPDISVSAAMHAVERPDEGVRDHLLVGSDLCCPMCEQPKPRADLQLTIEYGTYAPRVRWGCTRCLQGQTGITLDRMPDLASAMRWTLHELTERPRSRHPVTVAKWLRTMWGIFGHDAANLTLAG